MILLQGLVLVFGKFSSRPITFWCRRILPVGAIILGWEFFPPNSEFCRCHEGFGPGALKAHSRTCQQACTLLKPGGDGCWNHREGLPLRGFNNRGCSEATVVSPTSPRRPGRPLCPAPGLPLVPGMEGGPWGPLSFYCCQRACHGPGCGLLLPQGEEGCRVGWTVRRWAPAAPVDPGLSSHCA